MVICQQRSQCLRVGIHVHIHNQEEWLGGAPVDNTTWLDCLVASTRVAWNADKSLGFAESFKALMASAKGLQ